MIVGLAVGGVGIWYIRTAKPIAGDTIDTIAIDGDRKIVVRAEAGGDHSFVELWAGDELRWSQFILH